MKTKIFIISIIGLLVLTGCEDFLDQQPISQISEEVFWQTEAEVEAGMMGAYAKLQDVYQREFALTEMRSDNASTIEHEGAWQEMEVLFIDPSNSLVSTYWNASYAAIKSANDVLDNIEVVETATLKSQLEGEAKYIRALMHFNLVRLFKNIMWVESNVSISDSKEFAQSSEEVVYTNIVSDLTIAIENLPSKGEILQGRATKEAAQSLLGTVQLTQKNYTEAADLFNSVISSGSYALDSNLSDVFYTERGNEIIFAVEYIDGSDANSQDFSREFTSNGEASGVNTPTTDIIENVFASTDSTIHEGGNDSVRCVNAITYDEKGNIAVGKFVTSEGIDANYSGNDWIVLRYADVLLMYAEALLAGGTTTSNTDAVAAYTDVMKRAGINVSGITSFTKEELLLERRKELAFENKRWFDLERFGVLESTMTAFAEAEGFSFSATDLVLPIPDREIKASNVLLQNAGY